MLDVF